MEPTKNKRGFGSANYDREVQKAAARKGGASVPPHKRTFATNPELARRAGMLGAAARRAKKS